MPTYRATITLAIQITTDLDSSDLFEPFHYIIPNDKVSDIDLLSQTDWEVVVKLPDTPEYQEYQDTITEILKYIHMNVKTPPELVAKFHKLREIIASQAK